MGRQECTEFLQWALPRLGLRWPGYRKVRARPCKKIRRRCQQLGLTDLDAYRAYLQRHPEEWALLDGLMPITISRFWRDRRVFEVLAEQVLPELAQQLRQRRQARLRIWSAGCGAGEEPYSLAILWRQGLAADYPELELEILGTDIDRHQLRRATAACYPSGSLRDLPTALREAAFDCSDALCQLRPAYRQGVRFAQHDLRQRPPAGPFALIACRYLAYTYFDDPGQQATSARLRGVASDGGILVLGNRERLPQPHPGWRQLWQRLPIYRAV